MPMKAHTEAPVAHDQAFLWKHPEKAQQYCYKRKTSNCERQCRYDINE